MTCICSNCKSKFKHNFIDNVSRTEQVKGIGMVPKRALNVMEGEVNRLLVLTKHAIIPFPYIVPRKVSAAPIRLCTTSWTMNSNFSTSKFNLIFAIKEYFTCTFMIFVKKQILEYIHYRKCGGFQLCFDWAFKDLLIWRRSQWQCTISCFVHMLVTSWYRTTLNSMRTYFLTPPLMSPVWGHQPGSKGSMDR